MLIGYFGLSWVNRGCCAIRSLSHLSGHLIGVAVPWGRSRLSPCPTGMSLLPLCLTTLALCPATGSAKWIFRPVCHCLEESAQPDGDSLYHKGRPL